MRAVLESEGFSGIPPGLDGGGGLSIRLRMATEKARGHAAARIGLLGSVAEGATSACLLRFRSFYRPVEARFARFGQWTGLEIELAGLSRVRRLDESIEGLTPGIREALDAPREALPHLPTFAHALGGLYAAATFSPSHGLVGCPAFAELGDGWRLLEGLDLYGVEWPGSIPLVIEGAERTFVAMGRWMDVRHWYAGA